MLKPKHQRKNIAAHQYLRRKSKGGGKKVKEKEVVERMERRGWSGGDGVEEMERRKRRGGDRAEEMGRRRWSGGDGAEEMERRRWSGGDGAEM